MARQYRAGRFFIAGDAAHSHPPYVGYGVNTGFAEARNLGWRLAFVADAHDGGACVDAGQTDAVLARAGGHATGTG